MSEGVYGLILDGMQGKLPISDAAIIAGNICQLAKITKTDLALALLKEDGATIKEPDGCGHSITIDDVTTVILLRKVKP